VKESKFLHCCLARRDQQRIFVIESAIGVQQLVGALEPLRLKGMGLPVSPLPKFL
jgi:hypothetical protein